MIRFLAFATLCLAVACAPPEAGFTDGEPVQKLNVGGYAVELQINDDVVKARRRVSDLHDADAYYVALEQMMGKLSGCPIAKVYRVSRFVTWGVKGCNPAQAQAFIAEADKIVAGEAQKNASNSGKPQYECHEWNSTSFSNGSEIWTNITCEPYGGDPKFKYPSLECEQVTWITASGDGRTDMTCDPQ
ncbi:hypothetical protein TRL7639_00599 [Falsiruegeria litorea R37]|uniref:Lipoprotein n=1 Tax=Falsiruegeria litorea R37 TaxID=1200284 RepID=A0A1Y5RNJ2_9RHOB|nr:hypothetical protein [Falsiruegeria litorea]SLN21705.1 hypothetical protein TRL7639_00599 [Falsiruegeria litorea R37]